MQWGKERRRSAATAAPLRDAVLDTTLDAVLTVELDDAERNELGLYLADLREFTGVADPQVDEVVRVLLQVAADRHDTTRNLVEEIRRRRGEHVPPPVRIRPRRQGRHTASACSAWTS